MSRSKKRKNPGNPPGIFFWCTYLLKTQKSLFTNQKCNKIFEVSKPLYQRWEQALTLYWWIWWTSHEHMNYILESRSPSENILGKHITCEKFYCSRRKDDGSLLYLEIKIARTFWCSRPIRIALISENPLIEIVLKSRKEIIYKNRLLATVSHDLRTSLNGASSLLEIAREMLQDQEDKEKISL